MYYPRIEASSHFKPGVVMDKGTILLLVATAICFVSAAIIRGANKVATIAFLILGILTLPLAVAVQGQANTRTKNEREAIEQIEDRENVEIVDISLTTDPMTVSYTKDGQFCESRVLRYDNQWLLANGASCAKIATAP
jgi:hypothetical protein